MVSSRTVAQAAGSGVFALPLPRCVVVPHSKLAAPPVPCTSTVPVNVVPSALAVTLTSDTTGGPLTQEPPPGSPTTPVLLAGVPGRVEPPEPVLPGCDELGSELPDGTLPEGEPPDGEPLRGGAELPVGPAGLPAEDEPFGDDPAEPDADTEPDAEEETDAEEEPDDEEETDDDGAEEDGAVDESGDNQPDRSGADAAAPR